MAHEEGERWERNNVNKIVGGLWIKDEDDPEMDGEKVEGEVVVRDIQGEVGQRGAFSSTEQDLHVAREDLDDVGFTAQCFGGMSLHRGTAGEAAHRGIPKHKWKQS